MSSNGIVLPPVGISEVRGTEAANKLKASSKAGNDKIEKSAKDFESVLLSHWLEQAQQSFGNVPGSETDSEDPSRDQYQSLAMQAIGAAVSGGHGGLGIAKMVARHLEAGKGAGSESVDPLKIKDLPGNPGHRLVLGTPEGKK